MKINIKTKIEIKIKTTNTEKFENIWSYNLFIKENEKYRQFVMMKK